MTEEQRVKRNKRQYVWQTQNRDRINFTAPRGMKDTIRRYANVAGLNVTEWINQAIDEKIARDFAGGETVSASDGTDPFYTDSNLRALDESMEQGLRGEVVYKTLEELDVMAEGD